MGAMQFDIWSFLLILGIGQGISSLIVLRRRNASNLSLKILAFLIIVLTAHLTEFLLLNSGYYQRIPHLMRLSDPFLFLIGPAFYFFVKAYLNRDFRFSTRHLLHLILFAGAVVYIGPWFLKTADQKILNYERMLSMEPTGISVKGFFYALVHMSQTLAYTLLSFSQIRKYRKAHKLMSESLGLRISFLQQFARVFLSYWIAQISGLILITIIQYYVLYIDFVLALINAALIQFLSLKVSASSALYDQSESDRKYGGSGLSVGGYQELLKGIKGLMADKVYLESDLTLQEMSQLLGVNKTYLSQVINKEFGQGFPEYINHFRISHALNLMKSSAYADAKLLAIAMDSGFNNKTSFNRVFTKKMGQTPSEYRRQFQTVG